MSSNNLVSFLFGATVGVVLGLYLNSEKGKKLRNSAWEEMSDLESRIEEKVEEAVKKMKGKVNDAASRVQKATKN